MKNTISIVIIAKNEEEKIKDCLESVKWADEVIVIDTGSIDETANIARNHATKIVYFTKGSYADWRNKGLKEANSEWILYIDVDERVTPALRSELAHLVGEKNNVFAAYAIPRRNIILGKEFKHGGEWPDYQKRLFQRALLAHWTGDLHEEPEFEGELGYLENLLTHLKHDNLSDMVEKTNWWSEIEAKLIYKSGHPKMTWWRFLRIMFTEGFIRIIRKRAFLDGTRGIVYAIYQMWSKFITYGKLWELQIKNEGRNL